LILAEFCARHLEPLALLARELTQHHVCELIDRYDWILFAQPFQFIVKVGWN
jgi:hypothetical protein